jgi:hypothetical protein
MEKRNEKHPVMSRFVQFACQSFLRRRDNFVWLFLVSFRGKSGCLDHQPASEGRPITPAGWWTCYGKKTKTKRKSVWKGCVTQNHGGL